MFDKDKFQCTVCKDFFFSIQKLKLHYKSDWHQYNVKRSRSGRKPIGYKVFSDELILKSKMSTEVVPKGISHKKKRYSVNAVLKNNVARSNDEKLISFPEIPVKIKNLKYTSSTQSLFDNKKFQSILDNIEYMHKKYSFYIPNIEFLVDLKKFIKYLGTKIFKRHQCIYCNRRFRSAGAVRNHMKSKGHTSVGNHLSDQREEMEHFYNYTGLSYKDLFLLNVNNKKEIFVTYNNGESKRSDLFTFNQDYLSDSEWEEDSLCDFQSFANTTTIKKLFPNKNYYRVHINDTGNLVIKNQREAINRYSVYIYKQRLSSNSLIRIPKSSVFSQRQRIHVNSLDMKIKKKQTIDLNRQHQSFYLKIGIQSNKLNRTIKKAEKYFI